MKKVLVLAFAFASVVLMSCSKSNDLTKYEDWKYLSDTDKVSGKITTYASISFWDSVGIENSLIAFKDPDNKIVYSLCGNSVDVFDYKYDNFLCPIDGITGKKAISYQVAFDESSCFITLTTTEPTLNVGGDLNTEVKLNVDKSRMETSKEIKLVMPLVGGKQKTFVFKSNTPIDESKIK